MASASNIKGELRVTVISAKNFKKCDPYFKLVCDDLNTQTQRKNSCTEGTWNETLILQLDGSQDNFELQLWDWDRFSSDDLDDSTGAISLRTAIEQWGTGDEHWLNLENGAKVLIKLVLS